MKNTNEEGITLISLIITVIILVVLVALIDLVIPNDLFKKADNAEKQTTSIIDESQEKINSIKNEVPYISEGETE